MRADEAYPVIWRFLAFALMCGCASAITILSHPFANAEEPAAERIVRIGFVDPLSSSSGIGNDVVFWAKLRELGWVEGRNLVIETRSAEGHYDRLPALMTELVDRRVDVLVTYSTAAGLAAKAATSTIPIVDAAMGDPVRDGLAS